DLALGLPLGGGQLRALGALVLQLLQTTLELVQALLDVLVTGGLDVALLGLDLVGDAGQVLVPALVVDPRDHVGREVDDPLEVLGRQVQQVAQAGRNALEVPDVGDRSGELDVAHPVAPDLGPRDLDAAALADDALEPHPLVLAAVALPVSGRTEDALAEQAVLLGLQGAVVDGLRLLDLAVGPRADLIRSGQADPELIEVVDVQHLGARLLLILWATVHSHCLQRWCVPDPRPQSKSAPAGSRRDRSIPSSSAARKTSSSVSRSSISSPEL